MLKSVEKTMNTLEFSKIKHQLSRCAVSPLGSERALNLQPSTDADSIIVKQQETEDGAVLLRMKGGIPINAFQDIMPHLKRVMIGGVLNEAEVMDILQVIQNTHQIHQFFQQIKEEDISLKVLHHMSSRLCILTALKKEITNVMDEDGTISDHASSALRGIRAGIKHTETAIRDKLDGIVKGGQSKHLTDAIVTIRNDRYVIPVKAEKRSVFGGVVHDQSATGQTLFIEPQSVLALNNRLKQYHNEELVEIERILAEISGAIAPYADALEANLNQLVYIDFVNAKARYAKRLNATAPVIDRSLNVSLIQAWHPLIDPETAVPNDIDIGDAVKTIVVTGPNTGGKTVILKTLGLIQLMGQSGLHIPAEKGSRIGVFNNWFSDIGDEQSIEQSLSTFSSHLTNIVDILTHIDSHSLILLDELGAGTDPQEGAALAIAILDYIAAQGSTVMITSHYPELKAYGYNRPDTMNASMEFDVDTLSPTYRLLLGVPGRSNAFEIAKRLGLSSMIIDSSKQLMSGESQSVDQMINDLGQKRQQVEQQRDQLDRTLREANQVYGELKAFYQTYQERCHQLEEKAKEKANNIVQTAERKADKIIDKLRGYQLTHQLDKPIKEHEFIDAKSRLSNLKHEQDHLNNNKVLKKEKQKKTLSQGDAVYVLSFDQPGTLVKKEGAHEWVVQMGMLKMKIDESDLRRAKAEKQTPKSRPTVKSSGRSVSTKIDLRGERVHDAINQLDQYIDQALLAHYHQVTIIHGMGTGAVRKAVHHYLAKHSHVSEFNDAPANQGGNGATIVQFK